MLLQAASGALTNNVLPQVPAGLVAIEVHVHAPCTSSERVLSWFTRGALLGHVGTIPEHPRGRFVPSPALP